MHRFLFVTRAITAQVHRYLVDTLASWHFGPFDPLGPLGCIDNSHDVWLLNINWHRRSITKTLSYSYYRPQWNCGKVMFLHLSVILFIGGSLSRGWEGSVQGEGSLFRWVSVQGVSIQRHLYPGALCPGVSIWGVSIQGHLCRGGLCPAGSLFWGSLFRGSLSGGFCLGRSLSGDPSCGYVRVVSILLECILVATYVIMSSCTSI